MSRNRDELRKHLEHEEGKKLEAYIEKKSGLWHIGYGHLLQQEQTPAECAILGIDDDDYDVDNWEGFTITDEQCDALLQVDIQDAVDSLLPRWTEEDLDKLAPDRYIALISMAFQMGGWKIQKGFPSFCAAVDNEDWDRAADEMMWRNGLKKQNRSAWYVQTPARCQQMSDAMRYGTFDGKPETTKPIPKPIENPDYEGLSEDEIFTKVIGDMRGCLDEVEALYEKKKERYVEN